MSLFPHIKEHIQIQTKEKSSFHMIQIVSRHFMSSLIYLRLVKLLLHSVLLLNHIRCAPVLFPFPSKKQTKEGMKFKLIEYELSK